MGFEHVGNIKGDKGDRGYTGLQGLPGPNAVSNDVANAALVANAVPTETQKALDARYPASRRPRVYGTDLYSFGTSYTNGAGSSSSAKSFVGLVAAALAAPSTRNSGTGGSNTPSMPAQYAAGANVWVHGQTQGVVLMEAGVGEALSARVPTEPQSRVVFEECIRTALRWFRAKSAVSFSDSSVSLGGFAFENITGGVFAMRGAVATAQNAIMTITPGGPSEIVLLTAPWRMADQDVANNSDFEVSVDGGVWVKATTRGRGDTRPVSGAALYTLGSFRVTGLTPTSNVRIKKTSFDGKLWLLDKYLVMGNPTPPPVILVQDVPLVPRAVQLVTRTNLCANPGMETSLAGWATTATGTLFNSSAVDSQHSGAKSLELRFDNVATPAELTYQVAAVAGKSYTFSAWVLRTWSTNRVRLTAFQAGGVAQRWSAATARQAVWERLSVTVVAESTGILYCGLQVVDSPALSSSVFVDDVLIEQTPILRPNFVAPTWTGTAQLSTSTEPGIITEGPWNLGTVYGELASNDAMSAYREILRNVATSAEFADGTVTLADPEPRWNPATMLDADAVHPNDLGHAAYADAIIRAAQSLIRA